MPGYYGSSRSDDKDPLDEFKKYKKKHGKDTAREDMEEDGVIDSQNKSKEILLQDYISHRDSFQETFNEEEKNEYFTKLKKLRKAWQNG